MPLLEEELDDGGVLRDAVVGLELVEGVGDPLLAVGCDRGLGELFDLLHVDPGGEVNVFVFEDFAGFAGDFQPAGLF